jgi:hypothetical protein
MSDINDMLRLFKKSLESVRKQKLKNDFGDNLTDDDFLKILKNAEAEGGSKEEIVAKALKEFLERKRK